MNLRKLVEWSSFHFIWNRILLPRIFLFYSQSTPFLCPDNMCRKIMHSISCVPTSVSVTKCLLALLCQSAHLLIESMVVLVEVQKPYHFENDFFILLVEWMNDLVPYCLCIPCFLRSWRVLFFWGDDSDFSVQFSYCSWEIWHGEVVSQWCFKILLNLWYVCRHSNSLLPNPNLVDFPFHWSYSSLNSFSLMNTCNSLLHFCSSLFLIVNFCVWPLMLWSGEKNK